MGQVLHLDVAHRAEPAPVSATAGQFHDPQHRRAGYGAYAVGGRALCDDMRLNGPSGYDVADHLRAELLEVTLEHHVDAL